MARDVTHSNVHPQRIDNIQRTSLQNNQQMRVAQELDYPVQDRAPPAPNYFMMMVTGRQRFTPAVEQWLVDSGASNHYTARKEILQEGCLKVMFDGKGCDIIRHDQLIAHGTRRNKAYYLDITHHGVLENNLVYKVPYNKVSVDSGFYTGGRHLRLTTFE